jgi:protein SCO1/2
MNGCLKAIVLGYLLLGICGHVLATTPADLAHDVGFDQHLNEVLPLRLAFRDEAGRSVRLDDYFGASPVILAFSYYGCGTLCPVVMGNLADKLDRLRRTADTPLQVVIVSFDPGDSPALAATKKVALLNPAPDRRGQNWHLLTGNSAEIDALTRAAGFRYAYDGATHQYAHPAGIVVVTPQGRISRYFFGFDFSAWALRGALAKAADERIATPVQRLLLLCFHYDPVTGKYSTTILETLRAMASLMLLAVLAWLASRFRRERRAASSRHAS